jgi:nucleoside-triphosphatase
MKKIFLTGKIQIGKSTVVDKVISAWDGTVTGFRTWFGDDRGSPDRFLYISDVYKKRICKAVRFESGRPKEIFFESFNNFGAGLINETGDSRLIIMDELGRFESRADIFKSAAMQKLDNDTPVLGVLRLDSYGWLDDIRAHPNVCVIEVTEENRDELPETVLSILC